MPGTAADAMSEHALGVIRFAYYLGSLGAFAFLVTWEGGDPKTPPPPRRFQHILRNLALLGLVVAIADGLVLGWLMRVPWRLTESQGLLSELSLPLAGLFAVGFVLADLFDYAFHRLLHRWRWMWLIHCVHHSDPHVDASTGARFHPAEVVVEVVLKTSLFLFLGIPLWVEGARAVILNPLNLVQHANVEYPRWIERWFGWLLVTPDMHRIHHSPEPRETNSNFGAVFSFWDRLFGTHLRRDPESVPTYGLRRLADDSWQTLSGMVLTPIRARGLGDL
jgi:sterol desaturase/sphingolipid hydroxylase (fatty acid hydroxylase superfamily)